MASASRAPPYARTNGINKSATSSAARKITPIASSTTQRIVPSNVAAQRPAQPVRSSGWLDGDYCPRPVAVGYVHWQCALRLLPQAHARAPELAPLTLPAYHPRQQVLRTGR